MTDSPDIVRDPNILMGKPVITGARLAVEMILEDPAAGMTVEEMFDEYPSLTQEGLRAALAYAAAVLRDLQSDGGDSA